MKVHLIYIGIILLLLSGVALVKCTNHSLQKKYVADTNVGDIIKKTVDGQGHEHDVQESDRVKELETMLSAANADNSRLRKVQFIGKVTAKETIKHDSIPYAVHDTVKDSNMISVPKSFIQVKPFFTIAGQITKAGLYIDSASWKDSLGINIGQPKPTNIFQAIFKTQPISMEVITYTPGATIVGMKSQYYMPDKKWYQRGITKFGAGVLSGAIIYKKVFVK